MNKKFMILALIAISVFSCGKKESGDDTSTAAILALAGAGVQASRGNCVTHPGVWVANGTTWTCSASGMTLTCVPNAGTTRTITYPSVAILKRSIWGAWLNITATYIPFGWSKMVIGAQNLTTTYDSQNRATSRSDGVTFSNYDSNSNFQTVSNGASVAYGSYDTTITGKPLSVTVTDAGTWLFSTANGSNVLTAYTPAGSSAQTVSNSGSVQLCE